MTDLAAALEQLTIALVPGPVTPNVLAGLLLTAAGSPLLPALAAGQATAAVGLTAGTLAGTRAADGTLHVTGQAGPVLGAGTTSHVVLGCTTDEGEAWFQLEAGYPGLAVTSRCRSTSPARWPTSAWPAWSSPPTSLTGLQSARVRDLAATLFAAEAAGVAAWCAATAAGYAGIRRQFGRPIGAFQAVKHLCATMACRAERAAALAWDAARAADEAPGEHPFAAAAAAALALDDAVDNAKDCIQVLGGIGFTWEHDAHLYLRRALALRQLLGGSRGWRERLAAIGLAASPSPGPSRSPSRRAPTLASAPGPVPRSRSTAPARSGTGSAAPRGGRDHLVPAVQRARGRFRPGVAADPRGADRRRLAADRPEGVDVPGPPGGLGHLPGPHRPRLPKHQGITYFLVDMHAPGIDIRPLREITGRTMFNEVFLDDVFVPDDCVLGAPGEGWRIAMSTLATERVAIGPGGCRTYWPPTREYSERAGYHLACGHAVALLGERGAHPAIRKLLGIAHRQAAAETRAGAARPGRRRRNRGQPGVPAHPLPVHRRRHHPDPAHPGRRTRPWPAPMMDFTLTETQQAVADLAAQVLTGPDPWKELARAGLLDVSPPDGLGVLEMAVLLTEIGRAPRP